MMVEQLPQESSPMQHHWSMGRGRRSQALTRDEIVALKANTCVPKTSSRPNSNQNNPMARRRRSKPSAVVMMGLFAVVATAMPSHAADSTFDETQNQRMQWKTFRSDDLGFEIQYPTFGKKSRAIPSKYGVGFDFEFWSDQKQSYRQTFSVWKGPVSLAISSSAVSGDPGPEDEILVSDGQSQITYAHSQWGPDAKDLNEVDQWYNGQRPKVKFVEQKMKNRGTTERQQTLP